MTGRIIQQMWAVAALAIVLMVGQAKADPVLVISDPTFGQTPTDVMVIDSFSAGVNLNSLFGPSSASNDGSHASTIGRYRDTSTQASVHPAVPFGLGFASASYSPAIGNTLKVLFSPFTTGSYTAVYDGFGTGGSLNADLTTNHLPNNRFVIQVAHKNVVFGSGSATLEIAVVDNHGNHASVVQRIPDTSGSITIVGGVNTQFLLSKTMEFFFTDYTGVDLANVKSITMQVALAQSSSRPSGQEIFFGPLGMARVPEPASLSLLCLGSLALLRRSRKKRLVI